MPEVTTPGATWAIMLRPAAQIRNADGKILKVLVLKGVTRVRSEHGCMLLEGSTGEVVYTVPLEVVAYAGDVGYEVSLAAHLKAMETQGEA